MKADDIDPVLKASIKWLILKSSGPTSPGRRFHSSHLMECTHQSALSVICSVTGRMPPSWNQEATGHVEVAGEQSWNIPQTASPRRLDRTHYKLLMCLNHYYLHSLSFYLIPNPLDRGRERQRSKGVCNNFL